MKNEQSPLAPEVRADIPSSNTLVEQTDQMPSSRPRLVQDVLPWLTSLAVHAALVVFGVATATVIMAPPPAPLMQEQIAPADGGVTQTSDIPLPTGAKESLASLTKMTQDEDPTANDGMSRKQGSRFDVDAGGGSGPHGEAADLIALGVGQFSRGPGGAGDGRERGNGRGDGGPLAIFGRPNDGIGGNDGIFVPKPGARRIVFVCDATGTMIQKLGTLRHELVKAVAALRPNQSFNVIFFSDGGRYHIADRNGLILATPDSKRLTYAFLENIVPIGTTDPLPAIEAAFRQNPDLVYFLSDGEFNNLRSYADVVKQFDTANKERRCRVNTILFETYDREAEIVMQKIAGEHGGLYRFVQSADLPQ